MKSILTTLTALWLMPLTCVTVGVAAESPSPQRTKQETLEAWRQRRFGIFLHWGPSALLEAYGGSWIRENSRNTPFGNKTASQAPSVITSGEYLNYKGKRPIPKEVYDNLHYKFDPKGFDAREWARLFKEAGAGYVIFTAKHHDGFCNFDTKTRSYNIMNSPFRRDICKELADACRAEGLMFIVYYSVVDWWDSGCITGDDDCPYVNSAFVPQINELLANYGPLDGFWWDGGEKYGKKVDALIRAKQPWTIQNDRLGGGTPSDFSTPENRLGGFRMDHPWESCITMTGEAWFWNGGKDYISATTCLRYLIACAVGDGNLALDIGPRGDGRIDERAAENIRQMGSWLAKYGESVRGTRGGPYKPGSWGGSTRSGNKIFLHITALLENKELVLPPLQAKIMSARCLTGGKADFNQTGKAVIVRFTEQAPMDTVVEFTLDGDSMALQPIDSEDTKRQCLSDDKELRSSSIGGRGYNADCIVLHKWENLGVKLNFGEPGYEHQQARLTKKGGSKDAGFGWTGNNIGHVNRYWQAHSNDKEPWVEIDLKGEETVSEICITEHFGYIEGFACDVFANGEWKTLFTDGEMGFYNRRLAKPVNASKLRIRFLKTSGPASLSRVSLYR